MAGFDVSALTAWADETSGELYSTAVISPVTMQLLANNIIDGVKYQQTLNNLDIDLVLQAGGCGFTTSGSADFTQRTLTVADISAQTTFCNNDLRTVYLSQRMQPGSNPTELVEGQKIITAYSEKVAQSNENMIWRGNTSSADVKLNQFNGFVQVVSASYAASEGVLSPNAATGSVTAANVEDKIDAIVGALPEALADRDDLHLFVSSGTFYKYIAALKANGNSNIGQIQKDEVSGVRMLDLYASGVSDIKLTAVPGLAGTETMILTPAENLVIGTDAGDELAVGGGLTLEYVPREKNHYLRIDYKLGVQIRFPQYVVWNRA